MRFVVGIIVGGLLVVGGAYLADTVSPADTKPLVNWDVVGQKLDSLTLRAREGWRKISS
jgi:hypothetical protein